MRSKRHSVKKRQRVYRLHVEHPSRDVQTTGREAETARVRKRRQTREFVGALRAMLTGLVAMMAVSGAVIGLHQVFYENPDFSIGPNIHIYTDGQLTTERVLTLVDIPQDQNIFTVDLQDLQERIQAISVVRNVRVERRMPNQLMIQLEERHPIAWLSVPAHNIHPKGPHQVLVDRDGVPMHGRDLQRPADSLPIVQASGAGAYPIGKPIPDESLRIASALIDWWVAQPDLGVGRIEKITQLNGYSIRTQFE
ncbi:MAG: FtsQ-type POTRA domain-containing protein, partial [Verrucomicrobiota bacterium]